MGLRGPFVAVLPFVFGLLPTPSTASPLPEADWSIGDDPGDVALLFGDPLRTPASALNNHVDLVGLRIDGEDETGFFLTLLVDELRVAESGIQVFSDESVEYRIQFKLASTGTQYQVLFDVHGGLATDSGATASTFAARWAWGRLCRHNEDGFCDGGEALLDVDVLDEADAVRAWISKDALLERPEDLGIPGGAQPTGAPAPAAAPKVLKAGDQLVEFRVTAETEDHPLIVGWHRDAMPDEGSAPDAYFLRSGSANAIVSAHFLDAFDRLPVATGLNQTVRFSLANAAAGKRIVPLQYRVEAPEAAAGKYAVFGPPTLSLSGGQGRNLSLALNVSGDAGPADRARLVVRGVVLAHADEVAYASVWLDPVPPLTPSSNALYFHGRHFAKLGGEPAEPVVCTLPQNDGTLCHEGFLSAYRDDPGESAAGRIQGSRPIGETNDARLLYFVPGEYALPVPVAFAPGQPVEVELKLVAPVDAQDIQLRAELFTDGGAGPARKGEETPLFRQEQTATIGSGGTVVRFSGPPQIAADGNGSYLPTGSSFEFRLQATSMSPTGLVAWAARGLEIRAEESFIRLPVGDLPPGLQTRAIASPFQLAPLSDRESYVNPGRSHLFNLTVLNQGVEPGRVQLGVDVGAPSAGWTAELRPGSTYDLLPGDAVRVGALVRASSDAQEAEFARIIVNATAEDGSLVTLHLGLIATAYELGDDAGSFVADEEARAKLVVHDSKNTPGPAGPALLLLALALAWTTRRRTA